MQKKQLQPSPMAIAVSLAMSSLLSQAHAADPALNALGQSGGLVIPYGYTLPEGVSEAQYNSFLDPRYGKSATTAQTYWGAVGLLPFVEVAGGLANYPGNVHAPFVGADHAIFRHLMGDAKVEIPKLFTYQPAIALGVTDVGGQTHFFRSTYGVVSQSIGPATFTVGYGHGDRLNGAFGGAQLALWHTGISLLAEHDSATPYVGVRYQSPGIKWLADASVVGTVMRSVKRTNGVLPRASVSIGIQIPLGKRFSPERCTTGLCSDDAPMQQQPTSESESSEHLNDPIVPAPLASPPVQQVSAKETSSASSGARMPAVTSPWVPAHLQTIAEKLFAAGLERVRVGVAGHDLIVEYENHRYNQNEADALGIVLGVASVEAPVDVERIHAVVKKDNQPLAEITVDRSAYAAFVADGSRGTASVALTMRTRPTFDADSIEWIGNEHSHSWVRLQVAPAVNYVYGTEYGVFDTSLGAAFTAYAPLWRGAELFSTYIAPVYNTKNLDNGRVFSQYRLRGGLSDAGLAQTFWIAPSVLNVASLGKFDYQYLGAENETTLFVPGRPDMVRLRLAYLHHEPGKDVLPSISNAMLTYRWVQPAWKLWVEAGVARYVDNDKGPLVTVTRWFDDVSVSLHAEHSGRGSFVGATITFPLTPRQGMKPGLAEIEGVQQFGLDFRTRVGSTNYISSYAAENLDFAYSTQMNLLNSGRFSADYFTSQLYRMRDAYQRYAEPAGDATTQHREAGKPKLSSNSAYGLKLCQRDATQILTVPCM
ncbi:MAG TPA: YjbH domain-containing protein [Trinickia sp.]|uniref:YjbH domain-containing protein n=1 Tax=Trinickia sp. TaxID=2571163 RepID=UPI002B6EFAEA|nr:YjbH domain-containing protein [Trinickia sp.]HTI18889.1 YjbH domain-containing protein [Trinickia sp.]